MEFNFSSTYNYNQKEVLKNAILNFIASHNVRSMLDIGAGFVETAKPYSKVTEKYQAIEQDIARAEKMQKEGLSVIPTTFPCKVEGTYDLVLSSHSIPEKIEEYPDFLYTAWSLVNPQGWLVIITFKGANDTLSKFECELTGNCEVYDEVIYKEMIRILESVGSPVISKIVSTEKTKEVKDLSQMICWSLRLDEQKWGEEMQEKLVQQFRKGDEIIFPHEHLFICVQKTENK